MDPAERRRLDEHTRIHEAVYKLGIKAAFKIIGAIGIVLILGISACITLFNENHFFRGH